MSIYDQIIDYIVYISSKNIYLNREDIKEILDDIILTYDNTTRKYYKGIDFSIEGNYGSNLHPAEYDQGKIRFDMKASKKLFKKDRRTVLSYNLLCFASLLHELQHLQEKSKKKNNDIEAKLLKVSDPKYIYNKYRKTKIYNNLNRSHLKYDLWTNFYLRIHAMIPNEKLAKVNSTSILLQALKANPKIDEDTIKHFSNKLYQSLDGGYSDSKYSSSLKQYFKEIDPKGNLKSKYIGIRNLENSSISNINSTYDKMKYGLPIYQDEKEALKQKILMK